MATAKLFVLPKLSSIDDSEDQLHETEIWLCLTDLDKKKHGPAIYLPFDKNIRKNCCDIKVKDLNSDYSVNILLFKLKSSFVKDINQAAFIAYDKFEKFKRPANMNIVDFISKFERLYNNISKYDMELPKVELAHRLLQSVDTLRINNSLLEQQCQCFMYDDMKKQLKAIYDNLSTNKIKGSTTEINVEPTKEDMKNQVY